MKKYYNMKNNIIIQYNKTETNIVTYKEYCNTKTRHTKCTASQVHTRAIFFI